MKTILVDPSVYRDGPSMTVAPAGHTNVAELGVRYHNPFVMGSFMPKPSVATPSILSLARGGSRHASFDFVVDLRSRS